MPTETIDLVVEAAKKLLKMVFLHNFFFIKAFESILLKMPWLATIRTTIFMRF